jgi:hypothetical protein
MSKVMYKHTFANIISSFFPNINIHETSSFKFPPDKPFYNTDFLAYGFINDINNGNNIDKHKVFNNHIIKNVFVTPEIKEKYTNIFYKSQVIYNILCKKARLFKLKNTKPSKNDCDLYMNKLSNYKQYLIIDIYDDYNRMMYKFYIFDLIRIIKTSLSNSPEFFAEPKYIKNPYTNIKFTLAQLYHIYYFIKKSNIIIPDLFHQFYLTNFNLNLFTKNYECYIRDYYIKYFFNTMHINKKARLIRKMIDDYNRYLSSISIHKDFPDDKLIQAFNNDLRLYLTTKYSLNPLLKQQAKKNLIINLKRFNRLNPTFGRKYIRTNTINRPTNVFFFGSRTEPQTLTWAPGDDSRQERNYTFNDNFVTTEYFQPISRSQNRRRNRSSSSRTPTRQIMTNTDQNVSSNISELSDIYNINSQPEQETIENIARFSWIQQIADELIYNNNNNLLGENGSNPDTDPDTDPETDYSEDYNFNEEIRNLIDDNSDEEYPLHQTSFQRSNPPSPEINSPNSLSSTNNF